MSANGRNVRAYGGRMPTSLVTLTSGTRALGRVCEVVQAGPGSARDAVSEWSATLIAYLEPLAGREKRLPHVGDLTFAHVPYYTQHVQNYASPRRAKGAVLA